MTVKWVFACFLGGSLVGFKSIRCCDRELGVYVFGGSVTVLKGRENKLWVI